MALKVVITKLRPVTGWCLFDRMSRIARFLYHPLLDSLYIINAACRILVLLCCWWCRRNYRDVKRAVHNIKTHSSAHQSAVSNHPWMPWPNLLNLARIYIVLYNNISTGVLPSTALYLCTASYTRSVYSNFLPFHFVAVATRHAIDAKLCRIGFLWTYIHFIQ